MYINYTYYITIILCNNIFIKQTITFKMPYILICRITFTDAEMIILLDLYIYLTYYIKIK